MGGISERRKLNKAATRLCSHNLVVNGLRLFWIFLVFWGDLGTYIYSLKGCRWPKFKAPHESPTHVLLITDAQVRNPTARPRDKSWLRALRQHVYDLNLKKNWHVASRLKPHSVIFLGDMLASGKHVVSEKEYEQYYRSFKDIFPLDPSTPLYALPGNNDVGLGLSPILSKHIRHHYSTFFGPLNQKISVRNHTLVLLDASGLVEEDYQRNSGGLSYEQWPPLPGGAVQFVKETAAAHDGQPVILFSHIPLSRPDVKSCGPHRERGTIRRGVGNGYQNTFGKETTAFLLDTLRPAAVFSGDNRDYCEYTHNLPAAPHSATEWIDIREVTVKSFSMANQIRRPGFQLLSLVPPGSTTSPTFADTPCFLPDQYGIYTSVYAPFLIISFLVLFIFNVHRVRQRRIAPILLTSTPSSSGSTSRSNTPLLHPGSAAWAPLSPFTPDSVSPKSFLPPLRMPNAASPALRAFSRPSTPIDSPLLSPVVILHDEEEEDQSMYPRHYFMSREPDNGWSPGRHEGNDGGDGHIPPLGLRWLHRRRWSWSWSFILRGRRLRMTIRAPGPLSRETLRSFLQDILRIGSSSDLKQRSVPGGTVVDGLSVLWPVLITWLLIPWMF